MKLFLTILLSCVTFVLSAQTQIATLSHEGNLITKYGADAFKSLLKSAVDGDVITLSAGSFNSPGKIDNKKVIIRGAGFNAASSDESYSEPTIITGNTTIIASEYNSKFRLTFEGIIFQQGLTLQNVKSAQFEKCKILGVGNYGDVANCYFMHCIIQNMGFGSGVYATIINSIVINYTGSYTDSNPREIYFINSICNISNAHSYGWGERLQNCIITYTGTENIIIGNSNCSHNLLIGKNDGNPFPNSDEEHPNYVLPQNTNVFEDNSFYILADDFKGYEGTDGTELGIYGGSYPFSPILSNPQIKKFQVAPKTTADGKLSVDIEISMPN